LENEELGVIIFAAKKEKGGLLHTTIKQTENDCRAWALKKNLKFIILIRPVEEFIRMAENGYTY
jgi:hypothetical protein